MLLVTLVKEFLVSCKIQEYSPRTIKSYRNNLNTCLKFFCMNGEFDTDNLNSVAIKEFIQYCQERGCKPSYINTILKTLRALLSYGIQQEYFTTNPMSKVPWCKEKQKLIQTFTSKDVIKMLNFYSEKNYLEMRNKTILTLLFDTGIRCLELCFIKEYDVNDNYIKVLGKGNKERIVPISPTLQKRLYKFNRLKNMYFKDKNLKYDSYFLSRTGRPLTDVAVERIVKIAGEGIGLSSNIRCSPHTCRHWFAQTQIKNGLDIYSLSRLLGHTNVKVTQIYLNSMRGDDIIEKAVLTSPVSNLYIT